MTDQTIRIILQGDGAQLSSAAAQGVQALGKVGAAGEQAGQRVARGSQAAVLSMRQISPQLTDIATQLASGQSPFLVLLQQGGQLKDMAGGLRPMLASLAAVLSPTALLMGGAAAAVGLLGTAAYQGAAQQRELQVALSNTGGYAGKTSSDLMEMAQQVAAAGGASVSSAREIAQGFVASGRVAGGAIETMTAAALAYSQATGKSAEESVAYFSSMANGVAAWAIKHNESTHYATAGQIALIAELERTGRAQDAMVVSGKMALDHYRQHVANLGTLERAWREVGKAASDAWNWMLGVGRTESTGSRIASAQKELAELQRQRGDLVPGAQRGAIAYADRRIAELQKLISDLGIEARDARVRAGNRSYNASVEAAKIQADEQARRAKVSSTGPQRVKQDTDPLGAFITDQLNAQQRRDDAAAERESKRLASINGTAADYALQLQEQTVQINAAMLTDDRARMQAQIDIERQGYQTRIDELAAHGADVRAANDSLAAWVVARQAQMADQLKPEWQRMLEGWRDTTSVMRSAFDGAVTDMLNGASQQFGRWASGQGGSMGDVLKQAWGRLAQGAFQAVIGDVSKWLASSIASSAAASPGGWASAIAAIFGFADGGVFPAGTGVSAYRNQVVSSPTLFAFAKGAGLMGEAGPEAIMPLRRGPNGRLGVDANGAGRPSISIDMRPVINIDARSDQAQVAQQVSVALRESNRQLIKTLKAQGVL